MEKLNGKRFLQICLINLIVLFFFPLCCISYIYAAKAKGVSVDAEPYRAKGYEAQQRGDIDTAIEWYQKAVSLNPKYAPPHNDLGILYETKGWLDRAETEYQKALAIDQGYEEAHTNLALLYERKGDLEKAAFHWMRRYKLGKPEDQWTKEARKRLEKLGLIDKASKAGFEAEKPIPVEEKIEKGKKESAVKKKESGWTRVGSAKKKPVMKKARRSGAGLDSELQESLRLAEERLKRERDGKETTVTTKTSGGTRSSAENKSNASYSKAKDYYNNGEYAKALDAIRLAKQDAGDTRSLSELEEEIKFKMKEERIEDHYKEGMIRYRQKDFAGARKEFEAILSILPE